jgi:two-component sensor histidine kinase
MATYEYMINSNTIGPYIRNGILIGLCFPICSILICTYFFVPDNYQFSIFKLHKDFPLLWIIDSAPFVLGAISYIVGNNINKLNKKYLENITEINSKLVSKNDLLENLNGEKEVLLKEIHHRVKNNLQVITSLLSLQSSFIENEHIKALFRYSQYRINSMAMIHEMLYKSGDIGKINYGTYSEKLITGLILSMKGTDHHIKLDVNIDDINLNIDTGIPLGLIINEVVTNGLKYGIVGNEEGTIHISIKQIKHNNFQMKIGDNGVGFSKDINFRNSSSLGLMLIHKLSLQLQGNIEKNNESKGTNYIITFKEIEQIS